MLNKLTKEGEELQEKRAEWLCNYDYSHGECYRNWEDALENDDEMCEFYRELARELILSEPDLRIVKVTGVDVSEMGNHATGNTEYEYLPLFTEE